ncbi:hypothetical protein ScPMuIL_001243 [Solemya velum]
MSNLQRNTETPSVQPIRNTTFGTFSRSTRRYTPFTKTPKSRRLCISTAVRDIHRTPTPSQQTVDFKGLTNKTWKVYRLTPLYRFSAETKDQKWYGRLLSSHIETENQKSFVLDEDIPEKAIFSWYKGLKVGPDDEEALQIIIKGKSRNGNGVDVIVLTAFLLCVDLEDNPVDKELQQHFTYYPVMIVKGPVHSQNILTSWLERQFDCRVNPSTFSSLQLACIVAMWSGLCTKPIQKSKQVELLYKVPAECEGMSKITYSLCAQDCKDLWDSIHDSGSDEFTEVETQTFIRSIESHFYYYSKFDSLSIESHFYYYSKIRLSAMQLYRVGTPVMMLGSEGRLKIFSSQHALIILRHLTELSVEKFVP